MNTKKTVKNQQKEFDAVGFMWERRTKIGSETEGMNFSDLKKYFVKSKKSRGLFHDMLHCLYLPFIDVFLTNDAEFKKNLNLRG